MTARWGRSVLVGAISTRGGRANASDGARDVLAEEQAALRRVATLVAEGAEGAALFSAVADEVARVVDTSSITIDRYEANSSIVIASRNDPGFPVGSRWPIDV